MRAIYYLGIPTLLLTTAISVHAQTGDGGSVYGQQTSTNTSNLATYLLNLGADLGYDLTQTPPAPPTPISPLMPITATQLLGSTSSGAAQQPPFFTAVFDSLLGAIPVNSLFMQFVPSTSATNLINGLANATFPSYDNTSSQATSAISVNPSIDQPTFQQDPVSQAVLNILSTPNYTYCMNNDATLWTGGTTSSSATTSASQYPKCSYLYQNLVMSNTIGTLPNPSTFYTYDYNQQFLSQLNSNTLIAPLLYSTNNPNNQPTSSSQQTPPSGAGLVAQTQAQQAANFVRYVTGSVAPVSLPQFKDYNTLYTQAVNVNNSVPLATQMQAQAALTSYFTKLRVYAAQTSIAYSNLYYVLSKRMPQTTPPGSASGTTSSQALNEFNMATWRLYNSSGGTTNTTWLNQINQASPATVQKEMVTLLAEINYQMYLSRQQEERVLLTNTMLLLLSSRSSQPSAPTVQNTTPPK